MRVLVNVVSSKSEGNPLSHRTHTGSIAKFLSLFTRRPVPSISKPARTWTNLDPTPNDLPCGVIIFLISSVLFRIRCPFSPFIHSSSSSSVIHPLVAAKPNLRERESVHPARNILKRWIPTLGAPGHARSRDIHTQRRERKPERFRSRRSRSVWAQNDVCMREATRDHICALRGSGKRLDTKWHCGRKVVMILLQRRFP